MPSPARPQLELTVQYGVPREGLPSAARFRRWANAGLLEDAQVTLRLVGEDEGRALNRDFRGKDYATNVLTFPYADARVLSADIALCVPVILHEARSQSKPPEAHFAHLVVHGMLHLQGFDHETPEEAELMEAIETEIVTRLGYDDPWRNKDEGGRMKAEG
ncbi:MAG: rRNA maturation RNase YbeY [Burkholderiales bacterium]